MTQTVLVMFAFRLLLYKTSDRQARQLDFTSQITTVGVKENVAAVLLYFHIKCQRNKIIRHNKSALQRRELPKMFGVPIDITSDLGRRFESALFQQMFQCFGNGIAR